MKKGKGFDAAANRQPPRPGIKQLLDQAVYCYRAGHRQQAEGLFRQILQLQPNQPEALLGLGGIAAQTGQLEQARHLFKRVVSLQPDNGEALYHLGLLCEQTDRSEEAANAYRRALTLDPRSGLLHYRLATVLKRQGKLEAALESYGRSTAFSPNLVEAHNAQAGVLEALGRPQEAISCYRQALALRPDIAELHYNLGVVFRQLGRWAEAATALGNAVALKKDFAAAHNNLGQVLQQQGKFVEAAAQLERAIALDPNRWEAHNNLGVLLQEQNRFEEAIAAYRRALVHPPQAAIVLNNLGALLEAKGQIEEALACYRQALAVEPGNLVARWRQQLALPVLYQDTERIAEWHSRFGEHLEKLIAQTVLDTDEQKQQALAATGSLTLFRLPYQGLDVTRLHGQYGQLLHRILSASYPHWVQPLPVVHRGNSKIRVGYLSNHLCDHNGARWALGWLRHHDRSQFEIYCYHTGLEIDAITDQFRVQADHFFHLPRGLEAVGRQVLADGLQVLVFPDLGMDARTMQLAALRLAPVQCTAWGHPVTSGLPTVDYYLSSDLMEPEPAQAHYSERLVRLPKLGLCYPRPVYPALTRDRCRYGLRSEAVIYLCCQSLFKYLPQHDWLWPAIARQVPQAQFVFLSLPEANLSAQFWQRLGGAFCDAGLEVSDYCVLLPRLGHDDYLQLHLLADIFLDSIGWSGGNTTFEALAAGLPVVTWPGAFMRSRHAGAMLQLLAIAETVATCEQTYLTIAARLGNDPDWRKQVSARVKENCWRLFDDQDCVRALEAFFQQAVQEKAH